MVEIDILYESEHAPKEVLRFISKTIIYLLIIGKIKVRKSINLEIAIT